jgi:hypothetical protein
MQDVALVEDAEFDLCIVYHWHIFTHNDKHRKLMDACIWQTQRQRW